MPPSAGGTSIVLFCSPIPQDCSGYSQVHTDHSLNLQSTENFVIIKPNINESRIDIEPSSTNNDVFTHYVQCLTFCQSSGSSKF